MTLSCVLCSELCSWWFVSFELPLIKLSNPKQQTASVYTLYQLVTHTHMPELLCIQKQTAQIKIQNMTNLWCDIHHQLLCVRNTAFNYTEVQIPQCCALWKWNIHKVNLTLSIWCLSTFQLRQSILCSNISCMFYWDKVVLTVTNQRLRTRTFAVHYAPIVRNQVMRMIIGIIYKI